MLNACFARLRHERGAVLVHVTVAIIGLLAFSALVVGSHSGRCGSQVVVLVTTLKGGIELPDRMRAARPYCARVAMLSEYRVQGLGDGSGPSGLVASNTYHLSVSLAALVFDEVVLPP